MCADHAGERQAELRRRAAARSSRPPWKSGSRMIASRATVEKAMFWRRQPRRSRRPGRRRAARRGGRAPTAGPASRRATRRSPPAAARSRGGRRRARGAPRRGRATVNIGKREPVGPRPSPGRSSDGPVVPWQPPSRFAQTTNRRSVSIGLPGPISVSHQPRPAGRRGGPAACASPVSAWQTKTAFARSVVERPVGLVGDLDRARASRPTPAPAGRPR